jgi:hypothetical protein
MRLSKSLAAVVVAMGLVSPAFADVQFLVTMLDAAQEVPTPTGVPAGAGGTAMWTLDEATSTLSFVVSVHDLSGTPIAGHLHAGQPGVAGPIVVGLSPLPSAPTSMVSGSVALPNAALQDLFNENLYINYHTPTNPSGEIRGQVRPVKGSCTCKNATNHGQFVSCVKKAIKGLPKDERKEDLLVALKMLAPKSACGKKNAKVKGKKVACCLPGLPERNIVTGRMCTVTKQQTCTSKFKGSVALNVDNCVPNPCQPPASPIPAFLDQF